MKKGLLIAPLLSLSGAAHADPGMRTLSAFGLCQ
jgi:hypothetical protein